MSYSDQPQLPTMSYNELGTDRLLRPKGGRWFWRGGTILKQAPFGGVNFSLVKNMRGVKFYDTATAV